RFGLGQCREQQSRQNRDDGDDYQQFNQCKRPPARRPADRLRLAMLHISTGLILLCVLTLIQKHEPASRHRKSNDGSEPSVCSGIVHALGTECRLFAKELFASRKTAQTFVGPAQSQTSRFNSWPRGFEAVVEGE